jgi:hypothetical protein
VELSREKSAPILVHHQELAVPQVVFQVVLLMVAQVALGPIFEMNLGT